jgi:hypothetical protein
MTLGSALVLLLALAPMAFGAAPANDLFENATPISGPLPIEASTPNVGATKESGEEISFFAAGHSVWFEWGATATVRVSRGIGTGRRGNGEAADRIDSASRQ